MEKIFITGGIGLLGQKIANLALNEFETFATFNKQYIETGYRLLPLDITDRKTVLQTTREINPRSVIHAAALTDVDYCEDHPKEAWDINVEGTKNIAEACEDVGAKLVYVSTDFVFDGERGKYKEEDKTGPINYYGLTKLEGENVVKLFPNHAIARVSVLYGKGVQKLNFVTWTTDMLRKDKPINVVTDQYTTPTLADNAAEALLEIYKQDAKGVFHTSGRERISRYDFAIKIAEIFGLNRNLIAPIQSEGLGQKAKRPKDSSLDVSKTEKKLKVKLFNIEEGLTKMRESN